MKRSFLLPILSISAICPASAQDFRDNTLTLQGYVHRELASWTKRGMPVLFTSCVETRRETNIGGEKWIEHYNHLIFFPPGAAKGKYADFRWERKERPSSALAVLTGSMTIKPRAPHVFVELPDQGGPWEVGFAQMNGEYLLRRPMTIVEPKDFLAVISKPSETPCPDWDATSANPDDITRFYRKMGWYNPLPLPAAPAH